MADEEHVALLKRGVDIWNKWREENPDVLPNLTRADLNDADLTRANLTEANLSGAKLGGANLGGANLTATDLTAADLSGANLSRAVLYDTVFGDTNLIRANGLETCWYVGPSTIDHRTLQRSGPLPMVFLRGVGLPDRLIDYLPSILEQAIRFYSCFISYS